MGTDATSCKVCGGEFSATRVHIDGSDYHPRCAVMSYPSHTPEDYAHLSAAYGRLRALLIEAIAEGERQGSDPDGETEFSEDLIERMESAVNASSEQEMKHRGCTAWIQVHPTKDPDWKGIRFCEDRPTVSWFGRWEWQRVVVTFDEYDYPFRIIGNSMGAQ